jgi:hypothetical protein
VLGSLPPEAALPAGLTSIHPTGEEVNSANFALGLVGWHHACVGKGWPLGFSPSGSGRRGR